MSNSGLVVYTKLSPNHSGQRTHEIDRITPHCVVGQLSAEGICDCFPPGRDASCNYGIGADGRIALCVEEKNRSWCSSDQANDQRAVTIECASDLTAPYAMTDAVYAALIELCADICRRSGKRKLLWFPNKDKTLAYQPQADEMIITVHRWFANKSCPGDWLYERLGELAAQVTGRLSGAGEAAEIVEPPGGAEVSKTAEVSETTDAPAAVEMPETADRAVATAPAPLYRVQVGVYAVRKNADAIVEQLRADGYDAIVITGTAPSGD